MRPKKRLTIQTKTASQKPEIPAMKKRVKFKENEAIDEVREFWEEGDGLELVYIEKNEKELHLY